MASTLDTFPPRPPAPPSSADYDWPLQNHWALIAYWGLHAACLLALLTGVTAGELALCAAMIWGRMFGITAGYHRYFAHRTFKTSRAFAFLLALLGSSAVQKGPLWWAAGHRRHHRYSDGPQDMHSPRQGFWHSHYGWIFDGNWDYTEVDRIRDFARFPELVWLNRFHVVPVAALAIACFALGGWRALLWGFAIPTVLLWHFTYTINSLAHLWGRQRYATGDDSRNNWLLALLTLGEGWHNNHHYFMTATRQGFRWWEIDVTYYALRALQALGLVWEIREPPASRGTGSRAPVRLRGSARSQDSARSQPSTTGSRQLTGTDLPGA
jgi:stearoyl-CoA desaturase (delta-9 desaturase)